MKEGRRMVTKVDHVGIFVENLERSLRKYAEMLGLEPGEIEAINIEGARDRRAVLPVGDGRIELVDSPTKTGFAGDFVKKNGEAIHHIAFQVEDLDRTFEDLKTRGATFLKGELTVAPGGRRFVYFQPDEFNGVYIELIEKHNRPAV